jgi:SH3-like domain-containing protein
LALVGLLLISVPIHVMAADKALPVPRFVALRVGEVNLRTGPGERYPIEWVLTRKDMPVEIVAEFDVWRKIRDWQGTEGWVHERMVTGRRTVLIKDETRALHREADERSPVVARAEPGVVGRLMECQGEWCRVECQDVRGWLKRGEIWGVYSDEAVP